MKNLLIFLYKYAHVFFFISLIAICTSLLFIYNNYHQSVFLSSANQISGKIFDKKNEIFSYLNLREKNDSLLQENERLRNTLEIYRQEKTASIDKVQYSYVSAKIVNATKNQIKNYITINKGSLQGVNPEMGVISSVGVVGITYVSGENYSTILPLIHSESRLSVKLEKNDFFGSLSWNGKNVKYAQLGEIPGYVNVEVGDIVVTSGFSAFFPEGIPVGKISSYTKNKATEFYHIEVELFVDFNIISYVYVVINKDFDERKKLEEIINVN